MFDHCRSLASPLPARDTGKQFKEAISHEHARRYLHARQLQARVPIELALFGRDVVVVVKRAVHRHRAGKPSGGDYSLSSKLA